MVSEADKAIVLRFDVLDEIVSPDFILHSSLLGEVRGDGAYKQSVMGLVSACPNFHATVEDLIGGERDTVVTRVTYRGTDTSGFVKGHAATGKPFEFGGIYIWRLVNGKLAELRQESDRVRLMQQLGLLAS